MVHWGWLIVTAIASSSFTFFIFCILSINRDNPYEQDPMYWTETHDE